MHEQALSGSTSRVEALRQKHLAMKAKIDDARKCPSTTDDYMRNLKKQKLIIKEELEGLRIERKKQSA